MEGRLRNAVSVNKRLYKLLLLILKIIPFLLSINETVFTILHYYDIECYSLNFFGGFCDTAYATQTQTCALQNTIRDTGNANTTQIIAKLDAMQNQALLDKIDALREKNSQQAVIINNAQQTAAFGQMIGQATSPIVAAVNALQGDVNGIKCKLPETVTLPIAVLLLFLQTFSTMATLQLTTEDVDAITTLFGVKKGGNYVITYLY